MPGPYKLLRMQGAASSTPRRRMRASAPTRRVYFFASLPATKPDRALMTSTSTSSTTAVP